MCEVGKRLLTAVHTGPTGSRQQGGGGIGTKAPKACTDLINRISAWLGMGASRNEKQSTMQRGGLNRVVRKARKELINRILARLGWIRAVAGRTMQGVRVESGGSESLRGAD